MQNSNAYEAKNKSTTLRLGYWTFAWLISLAVATFGPFFLWGGNTTVTALAVFSTLITGGGMIWANKRHLEAQDELQQKIQLEAMALCLGVGLVVGLTYSLLDITNLISFNAEISYLVILMSLTYLAGVALGQARYK